MYYSIIIRSMTSTTMSSRVGTAGWASGRLPLRQPIRPHRRPHRPRPRPAAPDADEAHRIERTVRVQQQLRDRGGGRGGDVARE